MKKFFIFVWEIVKVAVISLAIIVPVRYYLIQPFYVKGASMEPNFHDNEYLIIDELSYRFNEPVRGQVIVFRYPKNPQEYFIKRVIALPGEELQIKNAKIIIYNASYPDGLTLSESYLDEKLVAYNDGEGKIAVGPNEYFVMGDNRGSSRDSRSFGPVNKNFIIGKVLFRGWPLSNIFFFGKDTWPNYEN
ncbi:signal peptidase I [Candidatus Falkowbacteria bacterium]|nr:signal peptidase I [Candidatus Falkowbacteria bacterium]NCT54439.1 signal peptidase I [Candidatus Falkowbacteria bacterium]